MKSIHSLCNKEEISQHQGKNNLLGMFNAQY